MLNLPEGKWHTRDDWNDLWATSTDSRPFGSPPVLRADGSPARSNQLTSWIHISQGSFQYMEVIVGK